MRGRRTGCACWRRCCVARPAAAAISAAHSASRRATITALLSEFEQAGLVEQQAHGSADGSKGRPPLQVSLASDAACAIGLDIGRGHVRVAVCNLGGGIVAHRWSAIDVTESPLAGLDLAQRLTAEAVAESGVSADRVIGVGVAFAAPVDFVNGTVLTEGILPGWSGIDPPAELEQRLGMPVQIENGANAGAIGEHMFGAGRGVRDMVYLRLSSGIGLGLIMAGRPYRGAGGIAGEIGHIRMVENGVICRCGNRGCLETVASSIVVAELLERSQRRTDPDRPADGAGPRRGSRRAARGRRRRKRGRARGRGRRDTS